MDIRLKRLSRFSTDHKKAKQLYYKAFPPEERAPFIMLSAKAEKKNVDFWGLYANDKWCGFMYIVNHDDLSYVFYFAISEAARGKGFGSAALRTIQKKYKNKRLFLAIEQLDENSPNALQRKKRRDFYLRSGFSPLGSQVTEGSVTYDLLGIGGNVRPDEYKKLISSYLGRILSKLVVMKIDN